MEGKEDTLAWSQQHTEDHRAGNVGLSEVVEDFDDVGKLGQGFASVDDLVEIDLGKEDSKRPTYISAKLQDTQKEEMCRMLREFTDCFAWNYTKMPGLSRDLVEHMMPIKKGFRPYKQPAKNYSMRLLGRIKEEVERLLQANFIRMCRYAELVSDIVPVEKKNTGKIKICVDFWNLNKVTPKDEYPMPRADELINRASGHRVISFLDGNAEYNQIFMADKDIFKTAFRCLGFVGLFEWVVMTFRLKNTGATYQRAMNLIFHDLLGTILEDYIDDLVVKSTDFATHIADLRKVFERMRRYNLKMYPLKCAFGMSAGRFLGFVVHEKGIEIDPKKIESINKISEPTCKRDVQKLLGKVNYLQ
jgi:hypothetical protein